jgi:hypothetical protein
MNINERKVMNDFDARTGAGTAAKTETIQVILNNHILQQNPVPLKSSYCYLTAG